MYPSLLYVKYVFQSTTCIWYRYYDCTVFKILPVVFCLFVSPSIVGVDVMDITRPGKLACKVGL